MSETSARQRLDTPRATRGFGLHVDIEAVGAFSESIARFLGTGRYLAIQTIVVVVWIALNIGVFTFQWDPYPFILLNLAFSTQAAYAARSSCWPRTGRRTGTGSPSRKTGAGLSRPRPTPSIWPGNWRRCGWPSARLPPATTCAGSWKNCVT